MCQDCCLQSLADYKRQFHCSSAAEIKGGKVWNTHRERERERERSAYFQYIYTYIQNVHPSSIVGIFSFDQEIENSREIGDNNVPGTFSSSPSFTCAESNHAILTPYLN
jgi:hypothetical protein